MRSLEIQRDVDQTYSRKSRDGPSRFLSLILILFDLKQERARQAALVVPHCTSATSRRVERGALLQPLIPGFPLFLPLRRTSARTKSSFVVATSRGSTGVHQGMAEGHAKQTCIRTHEVKITYVRIIKHPCCCEQASHEG